MGAPPVGTVTLLFTDVEGSTRIAREAGAGWADVLRVHHEVLSLAIERHGGYVDGTEGDAFFAVFADVGHAVDAAVEAQRELWSRSWPHGVAQLRVRMGLHTGFVERREVGYVSLEVHRAARISAAAHGGQVLISAATHALLSEDVEVEDLGLHRLKDFPRPERLFHVVVDGRRAATFGALRTADARPTNLAEDLTPLLGRDEDLARLRALFSGDTRLVTLVGDGGAGKTRLALALARCLLDDFPGGVFFVALASVTDPLQVMPTVARVLDVEHDSGDPAAQLAERLAERATLLVLDNFEHVLAAGPQVPQLLEQSRPVRVLVTSRAPLHVRGETVVGVDALHPDAALELFVQRTAAAIPGWAPSPDDLSIITDVCGRVGGLPLAIELAAARVGVLSLEELRTRLASSSDLLRTAAKDAPERHRSLRATFEWSHSLLPDPQQVLFRRMSAFAGPVPLSAVEAVAQGPQLDADAVLDALEGLVDMSLVRRVESPSHARRFTMPQALRAFAHEKLLSSGEGNASRRRHAEHVLAVAEASRVWFSVGEAEQRQLTAIDAEIRTALAWAEDHDPSLHRRLVAELGLGLVRRGDVREYIGHATRATGADGGLLDTTGAWVANCHAYALVMAGRLDEAEAVLRPALQVARRRGDPRELGLLLHTATWIAIVDQTPRTLDYARESLALLERTGDQGLKRRAVIALVQSLIDLGHVEEAEATIATSDVIDEIMAATWRGDLAFRRGNYDAAVPQYRTSLQIAASQDDGIQVINDAVGVTASLLRSGQLDAGLEAAGIVAALAADAGHRTSIGYFRYDYDELVTTSRSSRGADGAALFERGRRLDVNDRVRRILALAQQAQEESPHRATPPDAAVAAESSRIAPYA